MKQSMRCLSALVLFGLSAQAAIVTNGGFEAGLGGWRPMWTRDPGAGIRNLDRETAHTGQAAVRLEHRGSKDWSFEPDIQVAAQPGEIFEMATWLKMDSRGGSATLCVSTWDATGKAVEWAYGARSLHQSQGWAQLRTRFVVPAGVVRLQPRLIGDGPATVWVDDYSMERKGSLDALRPANLPSSFVLSNAHLSVWLNSHDATFAVLDHRTRQRFQQKPVAAGVILTRAAATASQINFSLLEGGSGLEVSCVLRLEPDLSEFTLELTGSGELSAPLRYPHPFLSQPGQYLVVPMNEGISYPVEDTTIDTFRLIAYGGHGICMAFWGVTEGDRGHAVIIETPDDAAIQLRRLDGLLGIAGEWDPQHGRFGYARRLRYVFLDHGGHVAIAKRYRAYARTKGLVKTLKEKQQDNPNVDLLVGAVNVWCWDRDSVAIVKDMQAAGIDRILWSNQQPPERLRALNDLGVLTSRYDIYQDVMDPANFKHFGWIHPDWTTEAWPQDIITDAHGNWLRGWGVEGANSQWYSCGVICDKRAVDYARQRMPKDLATHPYRCRFIDTTTAAPWNECYNTNHPMTRSESREWKMKLLDYVSRDSKLVTGCETGHDASVPFLHYFEGMLSLGPYRVPDAGRDMARIWTNAPEAVARFQLGHNYRLPLWELVYHDCVVAQWYWGDYNNKLPMLWDKRDLFNVLYGTPPMFMFSRRLWEQNKARFVQSYRNVCPTVRQVGWSEMTNHRFLTSDRAVQQTAFENGAVVTVNFGDKPHILADGTVVKPNSFRVRSSPK